MCKNIINVNSEKEEKVVFVNVWCSSAEGSAPRAGVEFFSTHDAARKFASDSINNKITNWENICETTGDMEIKVIYNGDEIHFDICNKNTSESLDFRIEAYDAETHTLCTVTPKIAANDYHWPALFLLTADYEGNDELKSLLSGVPHDRTAKDNHTIDLCWNVTGKDHRFELLQKELVRLNVPFNWFSSTYPMEYGERRFFRPSIDGKEAEDTRFDFKNMGQSETSLKQLAKKNRERLEAVSHG